MAYAGPTYIGKSTVLASLAAGTIDFTSSGRAAGDLLVVVVSTANQAVTTPSGFTQVSSSPQGTGSAATVGAVRASVFTKKSTGTETTVSIADSGNHQCAVGFVIRGASGNDVAIDVEAGKAVAASASQSGNALTTTVNNCLILDLWATDRDSSGPSYSGEANASLTNLTERHDSGTASGVGGGVVAYTGEREIAGSVSATTATSAASVTWAAITLALRNSPPVTGTLAVTEVGDDTTSMSGTVADSGPTGTLAVTESGDDTTSMSGAILVDGPMAVTESGTDTAAFVGDVYLSGVISAIESGSDTFAFVGGVAIQGLIAAPETGSDSFAFSGTVSSAITGRLRLREDNDGFSSSGKIAVVGYSNVTERLEEDSMRFIVKNPRRRRFQVTAKRRA